MKINNESFDVTEKQKRLVICLLKGITQKNDIINIVWYEQGGMVSDNNYHQLIHKFRSLLSENNLPKEMLRTIPRHGAILDLALLPDMPSIEHKVPVIYEKKPFSITNAASSFLSNLSQIAKSLYR